MYPLNHSKYSKEALLKTLKNESQSYGFSLSADELDKLVAFYEVLQAWNPRLHLVAPCSANEFARRHLLESTFLTNYLPNSALVADVGSGAGLPMIPCLIKRTDLRATLIESSKKKSVFLKEALKVTGVGASATVIAERFETLPDLKADFVTCRALDKFEGRLKDLYNWGGGQATTFLLYGGSSIGKELDRLQLNFTRDLLPNTERRFLFIVNGVRRPQRN